MVRLMITNSVTLYNYMRDRGIWCTLLLEPPKGKKTDELTIVFPEVHKANVSCNAHENDNDYKIECQGIIDWMKFSSKCIVVTPVIKFDSEYMKLHAPEQYEQIQAISYKKQVLDTSTIGQLVGANRVQLRYIGLEPISFDVVESLIRRPMFEWIDKQTGKHKRQDLHYLNVINMTKDRDERRKLRKITPYSLYSQFYKKLFTE